jgi:hypothetical protein
VKTLAQILELFEALLDSGVLIPGLALCFGFYIAYLLLSARNVVPMTREEAETLWKFHKQKTGCKAETWREITKKKKLVGFECECGFKHIQKKPLITVD